MSSCTQVPASAILDSMSEENVELIRQLCGRWENGDFATPEYFDPTVEYSRIGAGGVGGDGVWFGVDAMWGSIADWLQAWENFRIHAPRYLELDDDVLVLVTVTANGKQSGVSINREIGWVFKVDNGKIVRWQDYGDPDEARKAAGIVE